MIYMKKSYFLLLLVTSLMFAQASKAQFSSTIDDLPLSAGSYWNGSDGSGGFTSGNVKYNNTYTAAWGVWSGFSYSNMTDTKTSGFINQYSAIAGGGALGSMNYAVGYGNDTLIMAHPVNFDGLYVTNSTYAYLDMLNGSNFSKKFTTNDWFKLTINGFDVNKNKIATVEYYLADFRFSDQSKNYILNNWHWIDLSSFVNVSYVTFEKSSTDNSSWGMNTPDYFCLDEIKLSGYTDVPATVANNNKFNVRYISSSKCIEVKSNFSKDKIDVIDMNGKVVLSTSDCNSETTSLNVNNFMNGMYIVRIISDGKSEFRKVVI